MKIHRNTAYILTEGSHVETHGENLKVVSKDGKRELPLRNLESLIFLVWDGWISAEAARRCGEMRIGVAFATPNGKFLTGLTGTPKGNITLRKAQYEYSRVPENRLTLAKKLVQAKLCSQRRQLGRHRRDHGSETKENENRIKVLERKISNVKTEEELLGLEGEGASLYFSNFGEMIKNPIKPWEGRSRRPPKNPENALLSFLYTIATNDCRSALLCVGLDPYLGTYHHDRSGKPALALDLVEEFRTRLADQTLLSLFNNNQLSPEEFEESEFGWQLTEDGRRKTLTVYQTRKNDEFLHPWIGERITWGLAPIVQARRLARHFREEEEYGTITEGEQE
jgi:CRISP-associated protein Cas1